jgi:hypothetical protein
MALICSRNPIRIGLFVSSVASFVELQSTGPFCLGSICYSCCNLAKAVANLKESELLMNYLRLVLVEIGRLAGTTLEAFWAGVQNVKSDPAEDEAIHTFRRSIHHPHRAKSLQFAIGRQRH